MMATLNGVNTTVQSFDTQLVTIPMAEVQLEGTSVRALIDTVSPVTIVSLEFLLQVLAGKKRQNLTPEEWKAETKHA